MHGSEERLKTHDFIESVVSMSKMIPSAQHGWTVGPFQLTALPSNDPQNNCLALLSYWRLGKLKDQELSQAASELEIITNLLSLIFGCRFEAGAIRFNGSYIQKDKSVNSTLPPNNSGTLLLKNMDALVAFTQLEQPVARQLSRASRMYASALKLYTFDQEVAYFLLAGSIECMSNCTEALALIKKRTDEAIPTTSFEKFFYFINHSFSITNRPSHFSDPAIFRSILQDIYYSHRSSFVHGGKEISPAANLASELGLPYIRNNDGTRERLTPSFQSCTDIVRTSLMSFLQFASENKKQDPAMFSKLEEEIHRRRTSVKAKVEGEVPKPGERFNFSKTNLEWQ